MATPTVTVDDPHVAEHGGAHGDGHHGAELAKGYDGNMYPSRKQFFFHSSEQQFEASKLGMWLFLATEILLFGGMFVAYGIFRALYPEVWEAASLQLDTLLGAANTVVLLLSSLTMVWAIRGIQMDNRKVLIGNLLATIFLASAFLVVKYFEYELKFHYGIFPGSNFELAEDTQTVSELSGVPALEPIVVVEGHAGDAGHSEEAAAGDGYAEAALSEEEIAKQEIFHERRAGIFFAIYYMMTGIHAIHILIGIVAIGILAWKAWKGAYSSVWYTPVENVGLYWHIVDIIWIFVFPLMYLI
ncbi:MAG: cytochrome c oxidase subunit 3 family protein [Bacteroidota bacterium]